MNKFLKTILFYCISLTIPVALHATIKVDTIIHESDYDMYDGAIKLIAEGTAGPFTFEWSGPNGYNSFDKDISGLGHGIYSCKVTNAYGCEKLLTAEVNVPCKFKNFPFRLSNTCENQNTGSFEPWNYQEVCSKYTFKWENGSTNCSRGSLTSGTIYTLTVTDDESCTDIKTFTIGSDTIPKVKIVVTNICRDQNFGYAELIGLYPNWDIRWASPYISSDRKITLFDSAKCCLRGIPLFGNSCRLDTCVFVKESPPMSISTSQSFGQCNSNVPATLTATVAGGVAPFIYKWNNIVGDSTYNFPISNGKDSVLLEVTNAAGCSISKMLYKAASPNYNSVSYAPYPVCTGSKGAFVITQVKDLLAPYSFQWSNGQTGKIMTGALLDTVYKVTVTDARGCSVVVRDMTVGIQTVNVGYYDPIVKHSCFGLANGFVDINKQDGEQRLFYWSNETNKSKADSLLPGNYRLIVIENSNYDCVFVGNYTIKSIEGNFPAKVLSTCKDTNGSISIDQTLNKNSRLSVKWGDVNSTNFDRYKLAAGTYYATITYYDCSFPSVYTVFDFSDSSSISDIQLRPCKGYKNGYIKALDDYGVDPLKYTWVKSKNDTLAFNSNQNAITDLSDGIYLLTITDSRGCTVTKTYTLKNGELDTIESGCQKKILCDGYLIKTIPKTMKGFVMAYIWNSAQDEIRIKAIANPQDSFTVVVKKNGSNGWQQESTFKLNGTKDYKITKNGDYLVIVSDGQCEREFYFTVCTKEIKLCSTPKILPCTGSGNDDGKIELLSPIFCAYNSQTMKTDTLAEADYTFYWVRVSDGYEFGVNENMISNLSAGDYTLKYRRNDCWSGLFEKTFTITCNCNVSVNISELINTCPYRYNGRVKLGNVSTNHKIMWSTGQIGGAELKNLTQGDYSVKIIDEYTGCTKIVRFTIGQNNATPTLVKECTWKYNCNNETYEIDFGIESVEPISETCNNLFTCNKFHNTYTKDGGFHYQNIRAESEVCYADKVCYNGYVIQQDITAPVIEFTDKQQCVKYNKCTFGNQVYVVPNSARSGKLEYEDQPDTCKSVEICKFPDGTQYKTGNEIKGVAKWKNNFGFTDCDFIEECTIGKRMYNTTRHDKTPRDTCYFYYNNGDCLLGTYCKKDPGVSSYQNIVTITVTDTIDCIDRYKNSYPKCDPNSLPFHHLEERSISNQTSKNDLITNIYPNPFDNKISIAINVQEIIDLQLTIYDMLGNVVLKKDFSAFPNVETIELILPELPSSVYNIVISNKEFEILKNTKMIHIEK